MNEVQKPEPDQVQSQREPAINLPGVILALLGLMLAVHLARVVILNERSDLELLLWTAFTSLRISVPEEIPGGMLALLWTPFTYALLHADWMHLLINAAWLAAFGTPVARRYGTVPLLLLFFIAAAAGAALFAAFPTHALLIGASGGVAGLTGAACRFMFQPLIVHRDPETGEQHVLGRRLASLVEVARDRRAGIFIAVWLAGNAAIPFLPQLFGSSSTISWQAHLGGFVAGLLLVPFFERRPSQEAS